MLVNYNFTLNIVAEKGKPDVDKNNSVIKVPT